MLAALLDRCTTAWWRCYYRVRRRLCTLSAPARFVLRVVTVLAACAVVASLEGLIGSSPR